LILDCQSQSNPPNWIAIRIEQSNNPIQQYPVYWVLMHFSSREMYFAQILVTF
jgi:hypothetical protein